MRLRRTGSAEKKPKQELWRRCSKCGVELTPETARRNRSRKSGWSGTCRACDRQATHDARMRDPEQARARDREWYAQNKTVVGEAKKAWRQAHPDLERAKYERHRAKKGNEHWNEKARKWREKNPDRWAHHSRSATHRRRVRMMNAPATLTASDWLEILETFDHRCAYCLRSGLKLEQEHVTPVSRGGGHTADNVVPACRSCNARKKDRGPLAMVNTAA